LGCAIYVMANELDRKEISRREVTLPAWSSFHCAVTSLTVNAFEPRFGSRA
jgi:hypothetical protein